MNELYWLTTLGKINTVCWIFFALGILILLVAIPCYFTYFDEDDLKISIKSIKCLLMFLFPYLFCAIGKQVELKIRRGSDPDQYGITAACIFNVVFFAGFKIE